MTPVWGDLNSARFFDPPYNKGGRGLSREAGPARERAGLASRAQLAFPRSRAGLASPRSHASPPSPARAPSSPQPARAPRPAHRPGAPGAPGPARVLASRAQLARVPCPLARSPLARVPSPLARRSLACPARSLATRPRGVPAWVVWGARGIRARTPDLAAVSPRGLTGLGRLVGRGKR